MPSVLTLKTGKKKKKKLFILKPNLPSALYSPESHVVVLLYSLWTSHQICKKVPLSYTAQ